MIYVWSNYLKEPMAIRESIKFPSLLTVAPEKYYLEKFGTRNSNKIIKTFFNLSRGKAYENEKFKRAGLFKDKGNLIINTGQKVLGDIKNLENTYLKIGDFPEPIKDKLDPTVFIFLKEKILNNLGYKNQQEGLTIFAWSILSLFSHALPARFSLNLCGDNSAGKTFTINKIISALQSKFSYVCKNINPGTTYAALKETLRRGKYILHFSEAEGDTYDENIKKIIRASTYSETTIEQKNGPGQSLITPIFFTSSSTYNLPPSKVDPADRARSYEINYSIKKNERFKKDIETIQSLLKIKMDELGFKVFSFLYYNWVDFIKIVNDESYNPTSFGFMINNHKKIVSAELYAFYFLTGLISKKSLDNYKDFLISKEEIENDSDDYNKSYVDSIGRILLLDKNGWKKKTIRAVFDEISWEHEGDAQYIDFVNWIKHTYMDYKIRLFIPRTEKERNLWVALPVRSNFITSQLKKEGFSNSESRGYSGILESQYKLKTILRYGSHGTRRVICFPLSELISRSSMRKWESYKELSDIKDFYK